VTEKTTSPRGCNAFKGGPPGEGRTRVKGREKGPRSGQAATGSLFCEKKRLERKEWVDLRDRDLKKRKPGVFGMEERKGKKDRPVVGKADVDKTRKKIGSRLFPGRGVVILGEVMPEKGSKSIRERPGPLVGARKARLFEL